MVNEDEISDEIEAVAMRAQLVARRAIIHFVQSEAKETPDGNGACLSVGLQVGFLISIIEAGLITNEPLSAKKTFLELVSSVWDDAVKSFDED